QGGMLGELAAFLGVRRQNVVPQRIGHAHDLVQQQYLAAGPQGLAAQRIPGRLEPIARVAGGLRGGRDVHGKVDRTAVVEDDRYIAAHERLHCKRAPVCPPGPPQTVRAATLPAAYQPRVASQVTSAPSSSERRIMSSSGKARWCSSTCCAMGCTGGSSGSSLSSVSPARARSSAWMAASMPAMAAGSCSRVNT